MPDNVPNSAHLPIFTDWQVFEPLRKHRSFIFVFVLSAMLSALALTYIYSEKYDATANILLSPYAASAIRQDQPRIFGAQAPTATFKSITQSVTDLSTSKAILKSIVTEFHLDQDIRDYSNEPWYLRNYHEARDWLGDTAATVWSILRYGRDIEDPLKSAMDTLAKNIKVTNDESYVFSIRVRDKNRERAKLIVDRLAHKIIGIIRDESQKPAYAYAAKIQQIVDDRRNEIARLEVEIEQVLLSHNVASIDTELERGIHRLNELQTEQTRLVATIAADQEKIAALGEKLGSKTARISDRTQRGSLQDIAALDGMARGKSRSVAASTPRDLIQPADYSKMISDKVSAEVGLDSDRSRYKALASSTDQLRSWLQTLPALKARIDVLQSEVDRAKRAYLLVSDESETLAMRKANSMAELRIEGTAFVPGTPQTPIKIYHVVLAMLLGIVVAIAFAYLFFYFNIRLFSDSKGPKARTVARPGDVRLSASR